MRRLFILACLALSIFISLGAQPVGAAGKDIYIVQPGDTLLSIAARYGISADQLAAANGLNWSAWVYVGQQLIIPGFITAPAEPVAARIHIVQPGDTLSGIAAWYGTTPMALQAMNGLANSNMIYPGQQLVLSWSRDVALTDPSPPQPAIPAPADEPDEGRWEVGLPPQQSPAIYPAPAPDPGQAVTPPGSIEPVPLPNRPFAGEKWIDINLTSQTVTAYEGQTPVFSALASTGTWQHPTVVGAYHIYVKYRSARMIGGFGAEAYDLADVPYVMYFYRGYGLHGTYWHNNFGTPMSHGCVNLATPDAERLFNWAPLGTKVVTHN